MIIEVTQEHCPIQHDHTIVPAFGNNPAARYHGFHAEWKYNLQETKSYTITAKICGTNITLRREQVVFEYRTDPLFSSKPKPKNEDDATQLAVVEIKADYLYLDVPTTIWISTGYNPSGNTGGNNDNSPGSNDNDSGGGENGSTGGNSDNEGDANKITDSLTTQCLKNVMIKAKNAQFNTAVQNILRKFNVSTTLNFTIKEGNLNNVDRNAQTEGKVITLNSAALANASQEFIAKVIYHEVLHAHLAGSLNGDHQTMASKYVEPLTQTLLSLFPNLNYTEAQALSWSGLKETSAWTAFGQAGKEQIEALATRHKNLNNNYNHEYGTSCD